MEIEFINEKVKRDSFKYADKIREWESTEAKTIKFSCKNNSERISCYSSLRNYIKRQNKDYILFSKGCDVYLVRA